MFESMRTRTFSSALERLTFTVQFTPRIEYVARTHASQACVVSELVSDSSARNTYHVHLGNFLQTHSSMLTLVSIYPAHATRYVYANTIHALHSQRKPLSSRLTPQISRMQVFHHLLLPGNTTAHSIALRICCANTLTEGTGIGIWGRVHSCCGTGKRCPSPAGMRRWRIRTDSRPP